MNTTQLLPRGDSERNANRTPDQKFSPWSALPDSSSSEKQAELFRELAESLPQMIWMSDAKGVKTYCNRRYFDYTGIQSVAEMNACWHELLHVEDRSRAKAAWSRSVELELPYHCEYRMRRKDGVYHYFLARGMPRRGPDGLVHGWMGSITDVHEQKLAEKALVRSEKLAIASQMAASIAHQINNPLAAVTNAIYLASQEKHLSEAARTYLQLAESELARVATLTTRSLRFHRQSSAPVTVDVGKLIEPILASFRGRMEAESIRVVCELERDATLACFADDMQQVFAILIGNALDASEAGSRIRIRVRRTRSWNEPSTAGIRIAVADKGHGIPGDMSKSLFDSLLSTKGEQGTGLGLWVAQGIVRRHQGSIRFRSRTGLQHGTVFSLFFPLKRS